MTCFVYRIKKMVSFKLSKDINKDFFISYFLFLTKLKTYYLSNAIYIQNITLSTLLILAVYRMCVMYELCKDLAHHKVSVAQW